MTRAQAESTNNPLSYEVRMAGSGDLEQLEELVNLAYRGGKSQVSWKNEHHLVKGPRIVKAELEKIISCEDSKIITLQQEERILACAHVEKHCDEAHIGMLAVDPEFQNYGLGKRILLQAEKLAVESFGVLKAKMFVFAGREELLSWYEKMGYEQTGETMPFFGPESGLTPLVENAHFVVVSKRLA